jgi:hypothetical protein
MTGSWRKLHNEEHHNLYSSTNSIKMIKSSRMKLAGHEACMGKMRNVYKILVGKSEGKKQFGRWESNIKLDLQKIDREGVEWIHLAQAQA